MVELKDLFQKRDEAFKVMSLGIMQAIPNVMEGIEQFIHAREDPSGELSWEDITYFEDENFIMIVGVVSYKPGDQLTLPNGKKVEVSSDNVEYFKRLIRLGIPYDLAANGTVDDVIAFLSKTEKDAESTKEAEQENRIPTQYEEPTVDHADFNLEKLTPEQLEQLKLFALSSGGKN